MDDDSESSKLFTIIAHRCSGSSYPENTLKALENAIKIGVDMVEIDVNLSRDGKMVIFHDDYIRFGANNIGSIRELTYSELRKIDLGGGENIPLLEDMLDLANGQIGVMLDLKVEGLEERVLSALAERNMLDSVIFSGKNLSLLRIKNLYRDARIALTYNRAGPYELFQAKKLGGEFFNVKFPTLRSTIVSMAHSLGIKVIAWVIDSTRDLARVSKMRVDAITTDKPIEALSFRKNIANLNTKIALEPIVGFSLT